MFNIKTTEDAMRLCTKHNIVLEKEPKKDDTNDLVFCLLNSANRYSVEGRLIIEKANIANWIMEELIKLDSIKKPNKKVSIWTSGFVYLFKGENGKYKIGVSKDPKKRLTDLRRSSCENHTAIIAIEVEDPYKEERYLHKHFKNSRSHSEWFSLSILDVDFICRHLDGVKK